MPPHADGLSHSYTHTFVHSRTPSHSPFPALARSHVMIHTFPISHLSRPRVHKPTATVSRRILHTAHRTPHTTRRNLIPAIASSVNQPRLGISSHRLPGPVQYPTTQPAPKKEERFVQPITLSSVVRSPPAVKQPRYHTFSLSTTYHADLTSTRDESSA